MLNGISVNKTTQYQNIYPTFVIAFEVDHYFVCVLNIYFLFPQDKLDLPCVYNSSVQELMRCLRGQMESLITGLPQKELSAMALGLAHSLSRYKLKFSPDKVDTMIVQAICKYYKYTVPINLNISFKNIGCKDN